MKTIVFYNQKGGVGKTTAAVELATVLSRDLGYRVLAVDLCPQRDLSRIVGAGMTSDYYTGLDVFQLRAPLEDVVQVTGSFDTLIADKNYNRPETVIPADSERLFFLRDILHSDTLYCGGYDYVIIDAGTQRNTLWYSALIAGDYLVVPLGSSSLCLDNLLEVAYDVSKFREMSFSHIKSLGCLFTDYDPDGVFAMDENESFSIWTSDGEEIRSFDTKIYHSDIFPSQHWLYGESATKSLSIAEQPDGANPEEQYACFARELLGRIHDYEKK